MANYTQNYITAEEFTTLQNHDKMYQGFIEGVGYAYIDYFVIAPVHLYGNGSPYVPPGMDMFIQGIAQIIDTSEEAVVMSYGDKKVVEGEVDVKNETNKRASKPVTDDWPPYNPGEIRPYEPNIFDQFLESSIGQTFIGKIIYGVVDDFYVTIQCLTIGHASASHLNNALTIGDETITSGIY